ncbi:hypothetical protein FRC06_000650 [Ceratobasidium sp. 370]|nr:hypothetical protein FRC06_000650 [Ceratobasidium sp. 370]
MHFEITLSINAFSSTTTQATAGQQAYTSTNNYSQCFTALAIVAFLIFTGQQYLLWLSLRQLIPDDARGKALPITANQSPATSRGPTSAACQCYAPPPAQVETQAQEAVADDEDTASQRQINDRVPIAQAPQPSEPAEARGDPGFLALGVGVGDEDLPGPHHDIDLLSKVLPSDKFRALKGSDATREVIHREVREIFECAQSRIPVVLYFTGHGNGRNAFKLHGDEFIDVNTLLDWIHQTRKDSGRCSPVFLVFDHCRESDDLPLMSIKKLEQIYIVWACSPRQRAYEVKLDEALPYSEFLKAICLTLRDLLNCFAEDAARFCALVVFLKHFDK